MLSLTSDDNFYRMTQNAINTLHSSGKGIKFNVILVESNKKWSVPYYGVAKTIVPDEEFNYNRFLSIGLEHCKNEFAILSNNDLIFHEGFMSEILQAHLELGALHDSFGTWDESVHEKAFPVKAAYYSGYGIKRELTGWCIVVRREVLNRIGFSDTINQRAKAWYADNIYADLLQKHGIIHTLVRASRVDHLKSVTLKSLPLTKRHELTRGQLKKYRSA